ncbi:DUF2628 domain-containing protein [Phyllobacterium leguminum]|uniref:Uncharacterized protein DUF2628 n=1 Tax=Phyllobacterium leguminum TaxID=314237 RepID=A0A318T4S3_9HYPH|nr:DUF2628 domain-containing protein [Phyllobacterium leguminum]PYE89078.1 uncharacterized protein DUF2628 [Phyllobacterium leguminum]
MASFVVMQPPPEAGANAAERTVFVRDGFSLLALIVPVLWLLFHRLWFEATLILAVSLALGMAGQYWNMPGTVTVLMVLVSILVALEGNNWRLAALRRRGYAEKGVIEADDRSEAEIRYFAGGDLSEEPSPPTPVAPTRKRRPARSAPSGGRVGLVGYPGEN